MANIDWDEQCDLHITVVPDPMLRRDYVRGGPVGSGSLANMVRKAMQLSVAEQDLAMILTHQTAYDWEAIKALAANPTFPG